MTTESPPTSCGHPCPTPIHLEDALSWRSPWRLLNLVYGDPSCLRNPISYFYSLRFLFRLLRHTTVSCPENMFITFRPDTLLCHSLRVHVYVCMSSSVVYRLVSRSCIQTFPVSIPEVPPGFWSTFSLRVELFNSHPRWICLKLSLT